MTEARDNASAEPWVPPNSESAKYRHIVRYYCEGCGVDIGSQGAPVFAWVISFDLPKVEYDRYCNGEPPKGPIHLRGDCRKLPFESDSLAFAFSSHLIEDFPHAEWPALVGEWARTVRPGGYVIILAPEKHAWARHLKQGGIPNCAHRHEPELGEFAVLAVQLGLTLVEERMTNAYPGDYSLLAVFQKP